MSTTVDSIYSLDGEQIGRALNNAIDNARARAKQRQQRELYARYFRSVGQPQAAQVFEFAAQSGGVATSSPATPLQPVVQPAAVPASQPTPAPAKAPGPAAFDVASVTPEAIAKYADDLHGDMDSAIRRIAQQTPARADVERAQGLHRQAQQLYDDVSSRAEKSLDHNQVHALFTYQVLRLGNALTDFWWHIERAKARLGPGI